MHHRNLVDPAQGVDTARARSHFRPVAALSRHRRAGAALVGRHRASAFRGQAVVEFALASLLLLTLVFGTVDLGRAVFARTMLTNAVREAARQGAITPGKPAVIAAAAAARSPLLTLTAASFTITCGTWTTPSDPRDCDPTVLPNSNPPVRPLDMIRVCTDYPFGLVATRLIGRATITFHECEQANVQ